MTSFAELWDQSQAFRQLFLHNDIFPSVNRVDIEKAEVMWYHRYPKFTWTFCDYDGCIGLVRKGELCTDHASISGKLPTWKWYKGILHRYMTTPLLISKKRVMGREYKAYHLHQGEQVFGPIPHGYTVYYQDNNPFNLHKANLVLLSRLSLLAVKAGKLSVAQAVAMDDVLEGFIAEQFRDGPKRAQWIYTMNKIAEAAGVKPERVRQAVSRGQLDPKELSSVVEFCQRHKRSDIV